MTTQSADPSPKGGLASASDSRFVFGTPIGVDVGLKNLATLAPATAGPDVEEARVVHIEAVEAAYRALAESGEAAINCREAVLGEALQAHLTRITHEAMGYAQAFESPILVLEDLSLRDRPLRELITDGAEPECWIFPTLQNRLVELARAVGVPVATVDPAYSTRECHVCQQFARVENDVIHCTTPECPVGEVCRDKSAAVTLARRAAD